MLNSMDGDMQALANKNTQRQEDLFFAVTLVQQTLSKDRADVTLIPDMLLMSVTILNPFR
jgi:hypothetical protein